MGTKLTFPPHSILRSRRLAAQNVFVELGVVLLNTPKPRLDPQKSEWHDGQRRLVYGKVYKRRVRALDNTRMRVVWTGRMR